MSMYEEIYKNRKLKSALHFLDCEFIKLDLRGSKLDLSKESASEITTFARDASGGVFAYWKSQSDAVVHISSEGHCGRFASSLDQALLFIASFPFSWMDLLHSSPTIKNMNEIVELIETKLKEDIDPESNMGKYYKEIGFDMEKHQDKTRKAADLVMSQLGLKYNSNTLKIFSAELKRKPVFTVYSKDGNEYDQLS